MSTIGERIRKVRRALDMTQTEFALRIGSVQNTVTRYETGNRSPSTPVITLICREFGVNQEWLETGKGEMFVAPDDSLLVSLAADYGLNDADIAAIKSFLELPPEYRMGVIEWGRKFAAKTAAQMGVEFNVPEPPARKPNGELTREEMHAILDAELDAKEAAAKRGTSTSVASTNFFGLVKNRGKPY